MLESFPHRFLEETVLTVFFWIGLWGTVSMFLDHYVSSWSSKLGIYIALVIGSFALLHMREHIKRS
jgi:hypothetical protein